MAELTAINTLTLGNTFGTWYARTNDIIRRLNVLKTASITGGDGIVVSAQSAKDGGFTVSVSDTITKNMTFNGNVTILGSLNAGFSQDITGINVTVPKNTGVTFGNIVYIDSNGLAQKAKANDECTSEVVGVVIGFTGGQAQVATTGKVSGSNIISNFLGTVGATLQKGVVYFLSEGISGAGTTLEPNVSQYVSKPVLLGITADTGLILPYRGFIATYGLSGACGSYDSGYQGSGAGVKSLNIPGKYPFDTNTGEFYTTGDLTAVNYIYAFESELLIRDVTIDVIETNVYNYGLAVWPSSKPVKLSSTEDGEYTKVERTKLKNNDYRFTVFTTSGTTLDTWKLKNIKAHVSTPPKYSICFMLVKQINRFGCSSYINNENSGEEGYTDSAPATSITFNSKELTSNTHDGTSFTGTKQLSGVVGDFLSARSNTLYFTYGAVADGITTGTFSGNEINGIGIQSLVGTYPIIYGQNEYTKTGSFNGYYKRNGLSNRTYCWDVNSVIVGSATPNTSQNDASKIIDHMMLPQDINFNTASSGVTFDTSILGWNLKYGAVSETLSFTLIDFPLGGYLSPSTYEQNLYKIVFYFEFVKFNPITQTESYPIVIPINIDRTAETITMKGMAIT